MAGACRSLSAGPSWRRSSPDEHAVLAAIQGLGLEWHIIFNKGSVMVLPSGVTKATGLSSALKELGIVSDRVVGVGDAENDHAFLRLCGLSVAVSNALSSLVAAVDLVTAGAAVPAWQSLSTPSWPMTWPT